MKGSKDLECRMMIFGQLYCVIDNGILHATIVPIEGCNLIGSIVTNPPSCTIWQRFHHRVDGYMHDLSVVIHLYLLHTLVQVILLCVAS